jgi:hypothetical protein
VEENSVRARRALNTQRDADLHVGLLFRRVLTAFTGAYLFVSGLSHIGVVYGWWKDESLCPVHGFLQHASGTCKDCVPTASNELNALCAQTFDATAPSVTRSCVCGLCCSLVGGVFKRRTSRSKSKDRVRHRVNAFAMTRTALRGREPTELTEDEYEDISLTPHYHGHAHGPQTESNPLLTGSTAHTTARVVRTSHVNVSDT